MKNYFLNRAIKIYNRLHPDITNFQQEQYVVDTLGYDKWLDGQLQKEKKILEIAERLMNTNKEDWKLLISGSEENQKEFVGTLYMITIRPYLKEHPDLTIQQFMSDVEEMLHGLKYHKLEYCIEQKGKSIEEIGTAFHIHILFNTIAKNWYKSHIITYALRSKFKYNLYTKPSAIQVDIISSLPASSQYIRGHKKGNGLDGNPKMECIPYDKIFREMHNLQDIYEYGAKDWK